MFQTIYTLRILSFQNSARYAIPQILFITHSAKIISVHTAPPIAQMLRNLQLCFDPDIRAKLFVCAVNETRSPGAVARAIFINICLIFAVGTGVWVLFMLCFCLLVPQGACFPRCPQGPLPVQGGRARAGPGFIVEDCPCPQEQLGAGQRSRALDSAATSGNSSSAWALPSPSVKWE